MRRTIEQMMAVREDRVKQNLREVRRVITSIRKLIDVDLLGFWFCFGFLE